MDDVLKEIVKVQKELQDVKVYLSASVQVQKQILAELQRRNNGEH